MTKVMKHCSTVHFVNVVRFDCVSLVAARSVVFSCYPRRGCAHHVKSLITTFVTYLNTKNLTEGIAEK